MMPASGGSLVVVTPSYGPDRELCADLNSSVLQFMPPEVEHHIIVPPGDLGSFGELAGPRTVVHDVREFLPKSMVKIPRANIWANVAHPWPPVRGWIAQQIVKIAATAACSAQAVLLLDSDMVLVQPTSLDRFTVQGSVSLYRKPDAITSALPRHQQWHRTARKLLGVDGRVADKLPDYICWPCVWEPSIVRDMIAHLERVNGRKWDHLVGGQLNFSEMILYGVYVDEVLHREGPAISAMDSVVYSEETPLGLAELKRLLAGGGPGTTAVMISAKSRTPLDVRRRALTEHFAQWSDDAKGSHQ